jgi:hypothetical protein
MRADVSPSSQASVREDVRCTISLVRRTRGVYSTIRYHVVLQRGRPLKPAVEHPLRFRVDADARPAAAIDRSLQ